MKQDLTDEVSYSNGSSRTTSYRVFFENIGRPVCHYSFGLVYLIFTHSYTIPIKIKLVGDLSSDEFFPYKKTNKVISFLTATPITISF